MPPAGSAWPGASPAAAPSPPPPKPGPAPSAGAGAPPGGIDRAGRSVSRDEFRSLRRWLIVAAAWATAATVIAVLAFIDANDNNEKQLTRADAQVKRLQRDVRARIARLETRVQGLPQTSQVATINRQISRLSKVAYRRDRSVARLSDQLGRTSQTVGGLQKAFFKLTARVEKLESSAKSSP